MLPAVLLPLPEGGCNELETMQRDATRMTGETWGCFTQQRDVKDLHEIIHWRCLCVCHRPFEA